MPVAIYNTGTGKIRCITGNPIDDCGVNEEEISVDDHTFTHVIGGIPTVLAVVDTPDQVMYDIRQKRDGLLNQVDIEKCNAERWSGMTAWQQQLWRDHKQELRDFTKTCNLESPIWPVPPIEQA